MEKNGNAKNGLLPAPTPSAAVPVRIQTDNGGEFEKHFDSYCKEQNLLHFFNYPRHPQSNACLERFNRTIQEQFVNWHIDELSDLDILNQNLMEYLIWYNTEKPHRGIGNLPPLRYYLDNFIYSPQKSNMLWTLTRHCYSAGRVLKSGHYSQLS